MDFIVSASQSSSGLLGSVKHRAVCVGFKGFFISISFFLFFLKALWKTVYQIKIILDKHFQSFCLSHSFLYSLFLSK